MTRAPEGFVDATFWVQVEPEWNRWSDRETGKDVYAAKAVNMTQKRPDRPKSGTVLTQLTIRMPKSAFAPLVPEAVIVVPESMIAINPIEVVAEDANQ